MRFFEIGDEAAFAEAASFCVTRAAGPCEGPDTQRALDSVKKIVEGVRERGDEAVAEFTERFDGIRLAPGQFELTPEEIDRAVASVDESLMNALERARDNICQFHERNLRQSWEEIAEDGSILGQRITPLESVGLYVPGGKAFYPSSVLMNIVPANVAGVAEIVMVSPPSYRGSVHRAVLAAARLAGATRIFRVGGAQAIAALAYGTRSIPSVPKITGPGNIYVTLAKRVVSAVCDIDKEAGPSEIVVIADEKADPAQVAIELLAQAEHDEDAVAMLITISKAKAQQVQKAIEGLLPGLERRQMIETALTRRGAVFVVASLEEAARLANLIAPEHLSIQVERPRELFDKIRHAGAVMLGGSTPVAVADYYAGPNHILPTGRRARCASALSVEDFRRTTNFVQYSMERLRRDAENVIQLAQAEGLTAHARAVELRL